MVSNYQSNEASRTTWLGNAHHKTQFCHSVNEVTPLSRNYCSGIRNLSFPPYKAIWASLHQSNKFNFCKATNLISTWLDWLLYDLNGDSSCFLSRIVHESSRVSVCYKLDMVLAHPISRCGYVLQEVVQETVQFHGVMLCAGHKVSLSDLEYSDLINGSHSLDRLQYIVSQAQLQLRVALDIIAFHSKPPVIESTFHAVHSQEPVAQQGDLLQIIGPKWEPNPRILTKDEPGVIKTRQPCGHTLGFNEGPDQSTAIRLKSTECPPSMSKLGPGEMELPPKDIQRSSQQVPIKAPNSPADHSLSNIGIAKKERRNLTHLCLRADLCPLDTSPSSDLSTTQNVGSEPPCSAWHPGSKHKNKLEDITQGSNTHMYKHSQVLELGPDPDCSGSQDTLNKTIWGKVIRPEEYKQKLLIWLDSPMEGSSFTEHPDMQETRAKVLKSPLTLMSETGWLSIAIFTNETPEPGHGVVEPRKLNTIDERGRDGPRITLLQDILDQVWEDCHPERNPVTVWSIKINKKGVLDLNGESQTYKENRPTEKEHSCP
ncbi:hypothetical protein BS47DRAFT_1367947 [Hydnum rufescens UP504]|uniref:Uncharacterized protein n=1 Tax=Hydnum rufescens UP504 TaxID=1448309 RepID=A0A9P6AIN7_9AGAM|nr:hypothetical protein BS47DRAFT_1367947 [Hydnum rufescens UP504]